LTFRPSFLSAFLLAAAVAVQFATTAADAQLEPAVTHDDGPFGVDVQTLFHGPALKTEGVQWAVIDLNWIATENGSKGHYDFSNCDKVVDYYSGLGFRQIYILEGESPNPLYAADPAHPDDVIDAMARWSGAVAAHYKGRHLTYELGNEPEVFPMGGFWSDPGIYTRMARASAKAIKSADPDAKIIVCATGWMDKGFISSCFQDGLLADGDVDYVAFHGYHRDNIMPESGLSRDITWLRDQISQAAPGRNIQVVDTERGYGIVPFGTPKDILNWRNTVYTNDEQAAYLARHYLTEIRLQVPIIIWYKDMSGEVKRSLWPATETDSTLRPCGYVYRNLAQLLPNAPSTEINGMAEVWFNGKADSNGVKFLTFLRKLTTGKYQVVVALWNPIEAFDGKILESRKQVGQTMVENWRPITPADPVNVPVTVEIKTDLNATAETFNLLAKTPEEMTAPIALHHDGHLLVTDTVSIGPMPTVILVNLRQ
jgi:hypothetical protein